MNNNTPNGQYVQNNQQPAQPQYNGATKYCKSCGCIIPAAAVICTHCGCQVEAIKSAEQPQVIIINTNTNTNTNANTNANIIGGVGLQAKNKWTAFFLCFFFGALGAHKFYEGKVGMGILYLLTVGLFGIGWFIDTIALLFKPNPYYVR